MTRLALVALILVGCAAKAPPTATPGKPDPVADPGPPPMPKEMTQAELERRIAAGELKPMELEAVDRREASFGGDNLKAGSDELVTFSSMPGGSSSAIYVDRFRRIWVGISHHTVRAPPNVIISATRTFETKWKVPISYRVVGTFHIN
ncbi:MAG TPA: hypothetical protein VIU61_03715 [Kofleriaceae bacterium]